MATNFNITPYYDDYDIEKSYLRILFRPGHSVQARELTQTQTILQNQVSKMANHFFKEGAMVVPGAPSVDLAADFIKIDFNSANSYNTPQDFVGRTVVGGTTGIRALVVHAESKTGTTSSDDPDTLYLKYQSGVSDVSSTNFTAISDGGTTYTTQAEALAAFNLEIGSNSKFLPGEVIKTVIEPNKSTYECQVRPLSERPTGLGCLALIEDGIYYVQGFMTIVAAQTIALDKYTNLSTYKVGLEVIEDIITSSTDNSLLDNAQGTTNFQAPGADRYRMRLNLVKRAIDSKDTSNFVLLIELKNGVLKSFTNSTEYSVIEDTLARRTFEESGNYTVKPFQLEVKNLFNENGNRGVKTMASYEFATELDAKEYARNNFADYTGMVNSVTKEGYAHVITNTDLTAYPDQGLDTTGTKYYPGRTHQNLLDALRANMDLGIDSGKAYVQGYRINTIGKTHINYKRALDEKQENNVRLPVNLGNYIYVSDLMSLPKINDRAILVNTTWYQGNTYYYNTTTNGFVTTSDTTSELWPDTNAITTANIHQIDVVGTAKIKSIEYYAGDFENDYEKSLFATSGTITSPGSLPQGTNLIYKVYLYDVEFRTPEYVDAYTGLKKDRYSWEDVRGIAGTEYISQSSGNTSNLKPNFTGSVLSQYKLYNASAVVSGIDKKIIKSKDRPPSSSLPASLGIVYHTSEDNNILVKTLGYGNTVGTNAGFNSILTSNERIAFEDEVRSELSLTAQIYSHQNVFETGGSNIVKTGSKFVSSLRNVDEQTGSITNDTTYTLLKEYTASVTNQAATIVTSNLNESFYPIWSDSNDGYQIYTKTSGGATPTYGEIIDNQPKLSDTEFAGNIEVSFNSAVGNREITIEQIPLGISQIVLLAPTVISVPQEKTKTLVLGQVDLPYSLLDSSSGADLTKPTNPETITPTIMETDDKFGAEGDAIGTLGNSFNGTFSDANSVSYSLDYLQLKNSDISKLHAIYDTCHPWNVVFQTDIFGTVKYISDMTKEDFEFAYKAWSYYEATGVTNPYNLDPALYPDAPFAKEYNIAIAAGTPIPNTPAQGHGYNFGNGISQPAKILDITDSYDFDNGQRPGVLKLGQARLKPRETICAGRPVVVYDYFSHSSGDYASVNSYGNVDYRSIPKFEGNFLTDVLDFRPAVTATTNPDKVFLKVGETANNVYFPINETTVITDYRQYLPRKDKVILTKNGQFEVIYGASSMSPQYPKDPSEGMVLFKLSNRPFTLSPKDIIIEKVENKRYTMRDIGKLEKRINTLEYYTTLSLLEKETKDLVILDENGLDRFKNGFIVEPFVGHGIGDVFDPNYSIAVDGKKRLMRPKGDERNVNMVLTDVVSNNYEMHNGQIYLPFAGQSVVAQNTVSSKYVNPNPFAEAMYKGNLILSPSSDDWREVDRRPDLEINRDNMFDNFEFLANEMGILGTHWNSWQTTNVGEEIVSRVENERDENWNTLTWEDSVTESFNILTDQERTGRRVDLNSSIVTDSFGDRMISTEIIPFMREKRIFFTGSGMKETTKLYATFDGIDVSEFCTPIDEVVVDSLGQTALEILGQGVTDSRPNGMLFDFINRQLGVARLVGLTSGAERIVYGVEYVSTNSLRFFTTRTDEPLEGIDFQGTDPNAGEPMQLTIRGGEGSVLQGDLSMPVGRFLSEFDSATLRTNSNGVIRGFFDLPSSDNIRFRVGEKEFRLSDQPTPNSTDVGTEASAMFAASGFIDTKQETFVNTRVPNFTNTALSDNRTLIENDTRRVITGNGTLPAPVQETDSGSDGRGSDGRGALAAAATFFFFFDPIAQTFELDSTEAAGGCYLSSIDLFFQRIPTKDLTPIRVELRNVVNGYPGQMIIGEAAVLEPAWGVEIDETTGEASYVGQKIFTSADGSVATNFKFPSPVYVEEGTQVCFVVITDSVDYRLHVSRLGEQALDGSGIISKQPNAGVMFKSSNNQAWNAEQNEDIKFTLYRQEFDNSRPSEVYFVNSPKDDNSKIVQKVKLGKRSIETTKDSTLVKIHCPNHGIVDEVNYTNNFYVGIDGLLSTTIYGGTTDTGATSGIRGGKINGFHKVVAFDVDSFTIDINNQKQSTIQDHTNNLTSTDPAVLATQFGGSTQTYSRAPSDFVKTLWPLPGSSETASSSGRFDAVVDPYRTDIDSAYVLVNYRYDIICPQLTTTTYPNTSIRYQMKTTSGGSLGQTIYTPGVKDLLYRDFEPNENTFFKTPRLVSNSINEDWFAGQSNNVDRKSLVYKITLNSDVSHLSPMLDLQRVSATLISNRINNPLVVSNTPEEDLETSAQGGAGLAKYITREIKLANPATSINMRVAVSKPVDTDIDFYYKIKTSEGDIYREMPYVEFTKPQGFSNPTPDGSFIDYEFDVQNLEEFVSLGVKIVLKSNNTAVVPKVTDLRIIALAK